MPETAVSGILSASAISMAVIRSCRSADRADPLLGSAVVDPLGGGGAIEQAGFAFGAEANHPLAGERPAFLDYAPR